MFTKEMIAPCGLDCSICKRALAGTDPCADVMEKETRYGSQYPLRESPLENLRFIREAGMAAFLERERKQWTCSACGGVICAHTGVCSGCGRQYAGSMER